MEPSVHVIAGMLILVLAIIVATWALYLIEDQSGRTSALSYRDRYEKLIDRLANLVHFANQLAGPAQMAKDTRLLDSYINHLKTIETLMEAIRTMPSFSMDSSMTKAPMFLVDDMTQRLQKFAKDVARSEWGGSPVAHPVEEAAKLGCYFCSRPFDAPSFLRVRVKVDGQSQDVAACMVCNKKLKSGKKAKVLFFAEGKETVHWSKSKEYTPSEDFWGINDDSAPSPQEKGSSNHLTLVYSSVTPLSSDRKFDQ